MQEQKATSSTMESITQTIARAIDLIDTLVRLCRAEVAENVKNLGIGVAVGFVALIGFLTSLLFLLCGVVALLIHYNFAPHIALFIVGGALAVISGLLALKARANFGSPFIPVQTIEEIRKSAKSATKVFRDGR